MAKETGLGWTTCAFDDATGDPDDIRNDLQTINWSIPRAVQDWTGLDVFAIERGLLLADLSGQVGGAFNDATDRAHEVFRTVGSSTPTSRTLTNVISGQTLAAEVHVTDYAMTRGPDGSFMFTAPFVLANGIAPTWS
jgi:hypothetical protein